jgi:hypothetical protein
VSRERQTLLEKQRSEDLVHGIVATDILGGRDELTGSGAQRRAMQAAGLIEERLMTAQELGQSEHDRAVEPTGCREPGGARLQRINGDPPADPTG